MNCRMEYFSTFVVLGWGRCKKKIELSFPAFAVEMTWPFTVEGNQPKNKKSPVSLKSGLAQLATLDSTSHLASRLAAQRRFVVRRQFAFYLCAQ